MSLELYLGGGERRLGRYLELDRPVCGSKLQGMNRDLIRQKILAAVGEMRASNPVRAAEYLGEALAALDAEFEPHAFNTLPPGYRGWAMPCMNDPAAVWCWLSPDEMAGLTSEEAAHKAEFDLAETRVFDAQHRAVKSAWQHYAEQTT